MHASRLLTDEFSPNNSCYVLIAPNSFPYFPKTNSVPQKPMKNTQSMHLDPARNPADFYKQSAILCVR